jgi:hypothetical protein
LAGLADRLVSLDDAGTAEWFVSDARLPPDRIAYLRTFDAVVSYLHDPDDVVRTNLLAAGARNLVCIAPQVDAHHAADHLAAPLAALGVRWSAGADATLALPRPLREAGRQRLRSVATGKAVALHPGSGSPRKNWPLPRFVELARVLRREAGVSPFIVAGEAEAAMRASLARGAMETPILPECELPELAAVLAACAGYVGNDSGVTHLAAAVGTPVVALFGPTDPSLWGPRGVRVRWVRPGGGGTDMARIELNAVLAALREVGGIGE